ncbi:ammonia-dependent NAD(+) synthetase [Weissella coleopterorum]|uniref:NH(3)-dependent NAD(+) synthetase n=1 Tax=Weissella coleopterorum TaxID=2714949 RepID=A0A6G8AYR8_9LACO|nr:ammonia-dependent NAD(+) synthetase [Weissella coleopterorum]QIL50137.1 ammonia-dependent NAD(+) synthetase [Weissella coleopterorum]
MRAKQAEIIQVLGVKPVIDPEVEYRRSVDLLKDYLLKTGLKTYVLGISGGQDSTLAGQMAETAVTELRAQTGQSDYQFIAMRLPYGTQNDEADALAAIEWQQADQVVISNIKPATQAMVESLTSAGLMMTDFNKGNIKARQRMIAQYGVAGATQGAVIGTDHAAEAVTGFYTKFGDGAADIMPLYRLDKNQGRAILAWLNAPKKFYEKVPTADLEEDHPALPDEKALGVTYEVLDQYLEGKAVAVKDAEKIERWYAQTEHKRQGAVTVFSQWWQ